MSDEMERGQIEKAPQTSDHTRNSATVRYKPPVVSSRTLLAEMHAQPPAPKPVASVHQQPARPWDFLKRLSLNTHSGWLITTLVLILVITMTLSFGFTKGWFDAKITLGASVVFFVVLVGAMVIAHWPYRSR
ncbi:MAG: hypothetical protein J0I20_09415 [Chloroflexi bacterium]|nr:hypothetical protein [Chloroflexota bacterium]OJV94670.1 MAG: hypothetical protein BGO39_23400 [Chloroflexi bacterium 54-19]